MESWNIKKINIGDKLPKLITEPLTRDILKLYSIASGDHNPIHLDTNYAKGVGLPNIIAHGMLIMSYLTRLITNNIEQASIKEVGVKFTSMTNIGDTLTCLGEVEELTKEKGIYNLQLLIYMLGIREEFKEKTIKSGIINLKNISEGVLEGVFNGKTVLNNTEMENYKNKIIKIIGNILDTRKVFKN